MEKGVCVCGGGGLSRCSNSLFQQWLVGGELTSKTWPLGSTTFPLFLVFGSVAAHLNSLHSIMLVSGIEEGKKYKPFLFILPLPLY